MEPLQAFRGILAVATEPVNRLQAVAETLRPSTAIVEQAADAARSWAAREAVMAQLRELRRVEEKTSLAYRRVADLVVGPARAAVVEELQEHAADEDRHAGIIARRLVAMGGAMDVEPHLEPSRYGASPDLFDALAHLVAMEVEGIREWQELRRMLADDDPFRFEVEAIMQDEQHHADDLGALMRAQGRSVALATDN